MTQKELEKLKVKDVLRMTDFLEEMKRQVEIEEDSHTKALFHGKLKRTPLDSLREKNVFNAERMTDLFEGVLNKSLLGFSAAERDYIYMLGMLAFKRVMVKLKKEIDTDIS